MDTLERILRRYAYRTDAPFLTAPTHELFDRGKLRPIGGGVFQRVYRLDGTPWVVKEARWDPAFPVGGMEVPLPGASLHQLLSVFATGLLPTQEETIRQYGEYLEFSRYFGWYAEIDDPDTFPDFAAVRAEQIAIRQRLMERIEDLEREYGAHLPSTLKDILEGVDAAHNFLPREYLLWGPSMAPENEGKDTAFIVQEFAEGKTLHDMKEHELFQEPWKGQMTLLCYLILLLQFERGLLPDTRPRQPLWQSYDWLMKTDNIIAGGRGITFIDTRWLWRRGPNPVLRGFVIPELMTQACLSTIATLCD